MPPPRITRQRFDENHINVSLNEKGQAQQGLKKAYQDGKSYEKFLEFVFINALALFYAIQKKKKNLLAF